MHHELDVETSLVYRDMTHIWDMTHIYGNDSCKHHELDVFLRSTMPTKVHLHSSVNTFSTISPALIFHSTVGGKLNALKSCNTQHATRSSVQQAQPSVAKVYLVRILIHSAGSFL